MSYPETEIVRWLTKHKVRFIREYSFGDLKGYYDLLRFDFALFGKDNTLKALIEVQGPHHYEPIYGIEKLKQQQEYDRRKDEYCKKNNIPLLHYVVHNTQNTKKISFAILQNFVNCHLPEYEIGSWHKRKTNNQKPSKKYIICTK